LNWYFETAATTPENRARVLELVRHAPPEARNLFRLTEEDGKIILVVAAIGARRPTDDESSGRI